MEQRDATDRRYQKSYIIRPPTQEGDIREVMIGALFGPRASLYFYSQPRESVSKKASSASDRI